MRRAAAVLAAMLVLGGAWAQDLVRGPSAEIAAENGPRGPEVFRIRVVNAPGGAIEVSRDAGVSWLRLGAVTVPALRINPAGYTASKWAADSSMAASAVNALHVKIANHPETGRGVIFSIIPAGDTVGAAEGHPTTSIATDIAGGTAIFGGGFAPPVDSAVLVERDGVLVPLPADYVPAEGDVLVIVVTQPPSTVVALEFENRVDGLIRLRYDRGEEKTIGRVRKVVTGVGRFEGTINAAPGRIRANHPGVIDISTSPLGLVGGFQIIPSGHAQSPELSYVATGTAWMVVGPLRDDDPSWEGIAPLFAGYLAPSYREDDIWGRYDDWMERLLSRAQVQVRIDGGEWRLMPRIAIDPSAPPDADAHDRGREGLWRIAGSLNPYTPLPQAALTALEGVTDVRILLPRAQFWPGD